MKHILKPFKTIKKIYVYILHDDISMTIVHILKSINFYFFNLVIFQLFSMVIISTVRVFILL